MDDPLIVQVIHRYYPDWVPPPDKYLWCRCTCPFHGDETPSAAVNYRANAYNCMACPVRGDAVAIIKRQEGVTHSEAKLICQEILDGCIDPILPELPRVSGRRVYGQPGTGRTRVQTRLRRQPFSGT
ncbi:CHC2 zinc finger domain-containing protein [Mycobacteroides chelonae]|uniref:CHC2 zinc finger domain-containing protein n=1 Tax=Mycobacteroides chelonae TaxID=1774 RepID=UPI003B280B22